MISLQEMNDLTECTIENLSEEEQKVSPDWQRRLDVYKEAGLDYQLESVIFEMRCERAKSLGFQEVELPDLVELIMGEPSTSHRLGIEKQKYEYFYEHDVNKILTGEDCTWSNNATDYFRVEKFRLKSRKRWTCRFGRLNYLRKTIPYGVVLKIQEVKKLKLFNNFNVVAPIECWEKDIEIIDPILTASIGLMKKTDDNKTITQSKYYFIAKW